MSEALTTSRARAIAPGAELALVMVLAWGGLVGFSLSEGGMRLSWDALNHHIYLGWIAQHLRFDRDFMAAGYQSLQFPYLYWPVYLLAVGGAGARTASVVLATLHVAAVPAVWLIARTCIKGSDAASSALRVMAVALAFLSGVVLSLFDATSNDLLAAIPLVWALAFALQAVDSGCTAPAALRLVGWSGFLAGASVALKLSSGPIAILLPLFWAFAGPGGHRPRAFRVALGCAATAAGFILTYGYWGWQMWQHFGNPVYPFYDNVFAPLRTLLGWQG